MEEEVREGGGRKEAGGGGGAAEEEEEEEVEKATQYAEVTLSASRPTASEKKSDWPL